MALFRRSCTGFKVRRCPSDSGSDSGRPPGERGFNGQHPNSGRSNRGAGKVSTSKGIIDDQWLF